MSTPIAATVAEVYKTSAYRMHLPLPAALTGLSGKEGLKTGTPPSCSTRSRY